MDKQGFQAGEVPIDPRAKNKTRPKYESRKIILKLKLESK